MNAAARDHSTDQRQCHDAEQHAHHADVKPHVAVQDVAEFVCDHALKLIAIKPFERAPRDRNSRVGWRESCRERIDADFFLQYIYLRNGHTGCDRHFLDDVTQFTSPWVSDIG